MYNFRAIRDRRWESLVIEVCDGLCHVVFYLMFDVPTLDCVEGIGLSLSIYIHHLTVI